MAVPLRAIAERRVIERLLRAGALAPDAAQPLSDLGWFEDRGLARLLEAGVARKDTTGRYYLDGPGLADHWYRRRRRVVLVLAALMLLGALALLLRQA